MNFRKLGKNCPICNGVSRGRGRGRGDCRQSSNKLIHCRTGLELSTIPAGWKFLKLDNIGFGLFAPDDSDWSESQKQEWQQKVEADRKLKRDRLTLELASSLPVAGRDRAIKKLHKYLGLSQKHRQNLRSRHLTDAQIDAGYFFSIYPDQELPPGIPSNLPGVAWGKLATKNPGFACPAFDVEGNIIGWQLRLDDVSDNKYRWAKGWKSSHLPNGELPITVCRPVGSILRPDAGLAEGLLKPYIAAQKFSSIFIGAAGAQFSPQQLKASLLKIACTIVTLYPDAGAVSNPHVMRKYEETINLVTSWGYAVQVAWWGQIDKTYPDVDELISSDLIDSELIDPELNVSELNGSKLIDSELIDSELSALELISSELIDSELIDSELNTFKLNGSELNGLELNSLEPLSDSLGLTTQSELKVSRYITDITYITPQEFLALGAQYSGYTPSIPSTQKLNDCQDATISRDQWELSFGFGKRLRERIKQTLDGFKGFGKAPSPQPKPKEKPNKLFRGAAWRLKTWQDAIKLGYKYILDNSAPGLGKSHAAGIAQIATFDTQKLWYIANNHRNPTTSTIESNYVDLPVRHNGLKIDHTRKTPNGNPFLVWPRLGEEPDTQGNCFRTDLFHKFRAKNLNVEASGSSPICRSCQLAHLCKSGSGQKYSASFRGDRQNALSHAKIRAHADSLPSPDEFDYSSSGLIWDEVGTGLKPMEQVNVTLADFEQTWGELETKALHLHEALKPLRLALRGLLSGNVNQPYHGWDDGGIRALLPEKPENLADIINELEGVLEADLTFLESKFETITAEDRRRLGISKEQQQLANRHFRRQAHEEFSQGFQTIALNWLIPFLKIWSGSRGALRCEREILTIFTHNDRYAAVASSAKFNIFLDATISRERLALLLGISPSEIYMVEQSVPNHGNLKIIQVTGMGKLGKDRSKSLIERVEVLKSALSLTYPDIIYGDWKKHTSTGDGQWFVDLRGSNQFQNASALAVFGVPYQNVGYLSCLYQTLTGIYAPLDQEDSHSGLQRFIEDTTQAEIEQAVGRLRAHVRPNEQLTFIFVGDYDLSFLGLPIEQVEAFQICPQAGTPTQVTRWKIKEAVRQVRDLGEKITQQAIAHHAGISQPLIAKIAAQFGGWGRLKKLLLALLDPLYSDSNNFAAVASDSGSEVRASDELKWFAQTYLPLLLDESPEKAVENIGEMIQVYGISAFLRILAVSGLQTQVKLLALVLRGLPEIFLQDFFHYTS